MFPREKFSRIFLFAAIGAEGIERHLVQDCGGGKNGVLRNTQGASGSCYATGYCNRFGCTCWCQPVADAPGKYSEER